MTRTPSRTRTRTTRSTEHAAHRPLMHSVHIAPCGSRMPRVCHPIHACAPVSCVLIVFSSLVSLFLFQPFLMSTSAYNERSMSNPLCDFRLGSVVTSDYVTPLTGYEPNQEMNLTDAEEARPHDLQRYLLPERPGRPLFLPQRSRRRRQ